MSDRTSNNSAAASLEPAEAKRALLARKLAERSAARASVIPSRADPSVAPLSGAQEEIWLQEVGASGRIANNLATAWVVRGALNLPALQSALQALVDRHEILRTTYELRAEGPRQIIRQAASMNLEVRESRAGVDATEHLLRDWVRRPFDIAQDLPVRALFVHTADHEGILAIVIHHIATDGVSRGVFNEELSALYAAGVDGVAHSLPPVAVQYGDFAAWEHATPQEERFAQQIERWNDRLRDAPDALDIPTDRMRSIAPEFDGATSSFTLSRDTLAHLHAEARRMDATPFMLLFAAFNVLLSRYTGQDDLVVGVPVAGRRRPELTRALGFYANSVAIRSDLSGNPTFAELVGRVRAASLEAFDDQDAPFARVKAALHVQGRSAQAPLFQVMFALQNHSAPPLSLKGVTLESREMTVGATKFELTLLASEREDGLRLAMQHRLDLFDTATADRMVRHLGTLIAAAVAAPQTRVASLQIIDDEERRTLLQTFNDSDATWPETATLHELFAKQAAAVPDNVAVTFGKEQLSYRELDRRANAVARALQAQGVGPESLVAVFMERSADTIVALLGTLKAGGAYVPIDTVYPEDRVAYMLSDSNARVVLTDAATVSRLHAIDVPVMVVQSVWSDPANATDQAPAVSVKPSNLCYVIYTSGSTGRPKGVLVEHRNVVRLLFNSRFAFDFSNADVWTVFHSFAFDFSVWEMYGALLYGGRLVVVPHEVARQSSEFLDLLVRERVTVLNQVPSAFYALAQQELDGPAHALALRYVIFGGEALQPALLRDWKARFRQTRLINMFGITETTVHVTFKEIGDAEIANGASNIGRPIPTLTTYILDEHLQLAPIGVPGEICVGGAGVARGYLNRPALTAERFIEHPFRSGERMYRSGDLGRMHPTGEIEYLGRRDAQVKLRGFRIELGEIQAALVSHEAVAQAAVVLRDEHDGILVGYVVPDATHAATVRRIAAMESADANLPERHELPNGLEIFGRNRRESEFLFKEIYEGTGYLNNGLTIEDGDVVFDVGANIGLFTVFAGTYAPNTRVYSFEPLPPLFAAVDANVRAHHVAGRAFACGLGSRDETVTFTYYPQNTVVSGRFADAHTDAEVVRRYLTNVDTQSQGAQSLDELLSYTLQSEQHVCRIRTMSDIIAEEGIERIDLLKVDVEKAEWDVLMGIRDEDWPKIQQVVMEVHDEEDRLERTLALLRSKGFDCVAEEEAMLVGTGLFGVTARRPERAARSAARAMASQVAPAIPEQWRSTTALRAALLNHLRVSLPEYMVPGRLVFMDALPLTSSGKLDRRSLPALDAPIHVDEPPRGPVEAVVASVWRETLQTSDIGRTTSFFELGGHSLLATRVISALQKLLRVQLPLRVMFDAPTVAAIAEALVERETTKGRTQRVAELVLKLQADTRNSNATSMEQKI